MPPGAPQLRDKWSGWRNKADSNAPMANSGMPKTFLVAFYQLAFSIAASKTNINTRTTHKISPKSSPGNTIASCRTLLE